MDLPSGRIAAYETEFADFKDCRKAADAFLAQPWPVNATCEEHEPVDSAGRPVPVISIKVTPAGGECYEMRFSVNSPPLAGETGSLLRNRKSSG